VSPSPNNTVESAPLLTVKQVATRINCSERTVYRLADSGEMPRPLKIGWLVRWRVSDIEKWIEAGCAKV
jgi:excisionase family DNA binding protein